MLELNLDGTFRFRTVVILVGRQNGKTLLMQVVSLWRMYVDGIALVLGTAQRLDIAEEAWESTVELAQSVPELATEVKHVDRTNGKKALRLKTGERYRVAPASRRGGRGLSGDLVLLDELREHQNWEAWASVTKTTLARQYAQVVAMSNAGDGKSVVLFHLRQRALAAIAANDQDTSLGMFEWSAPEDAAVDDRQAWAMANPSLGHTITEAAIANALETDDEDIFRTEVLCQWVTSVINPTIPPDDWEDCFSADSHIAGAVTLAVDINPTRTRAAISAAGKSSIADRWHTQLIEAGAGTDWLARTLIDWARAENAKVYLDPTLSGSLIPALTQAGVEVETVTGRAVAQACGALFDAVTGKTLAHPGQETLDDAVLVVRTRRVGEGFAWSHRGVDDDITPIASVTWALWGAMQDAESDYDVLDSVL